MARKVKDLTNKKFGHLTVIKMNEERGPFNKVMCTCKCDCGNVVVKYSNSLQQGKVTSCGCKRGNHKHDMTDSRLYRIWLGIRNRCCNPNVKDYENYGQRGISICEDWKEFYNFYIWAQDSGYNDKLSIDRIDVNGNYEPDNCRWVTMKEQANNKRNNIYITHNNESITLKELSNRTGINYQTLFGRFKKGDRDERLIRPVDKTKSTRR